MKYIALAVVVLGAAGGVAYSTYPDEFKQHAGAAEGVARRAWEAVEANPAPVLVALGTFLLTVVYHKARGKSLRESVEVAATRVTVVPLPAAPADAENPVVRRAKARATRAQLIADHIGVQTRQRKLPDALVKAEKEACYTEQALADAGRAWEDRQRAHDEAVAKLESLRKEQAEIDAELAEMEAELKKLAALV
jgi:chromosome segregation ATPase